MSALWSRILVSVVGLPLVLGLVYLGGWWLFGLVAIAAVIALHELFWMARTLRRPASWTVLPTILPSRLRRIAGRRATAGASTAHSCR